MLSPNKTVRFTSKTQNQKHLLTLFPSPKSTTTPSASTTIERHNPPPTKSNLSSISMVSPIEPPCNQTQGSTIPEHRQALSQPHSSNGPPNPIRYLSNQMQPSVFPQNLQALTRPPSVYIPPNRTPAITIHEASNRTEASPFREPLEPWLTRSFLADMSAATKWGIFIQLIALSLTCVGLWYAGQSSKKGQA